MTYDEWKADAPSPEVERYGCWTCGGYGCVLCGYRGWVYEDELEDEHDDDDPVQA